MKTWGFSHRSSGGAERFTHHHLKTTLWQLVSFTPPVSSAGLRWSGSSVFPPAPLSSPPRWRPLIFPVGDSPILNHRSTPVIQKPHQAPAVLVTAKPPDRVWRGLDRPHTCSLLLDSFISFYPLFFLIQLRHPPELHFHCGQENMKGTWKANATRLQQLQQSEYINDQQMSHKVTELPTGAQTGADTTEQVEDIWDSSCSGNMRKTLWICEVNCVKQCCGFFLFFLFLWSLFFPPFTWIFLKRVLCMRVFFHLKIQLHRAVKTEPGAL